MADIPDQISLKKKDIRTKRPRSDISKKITTPEFLTSPTWYNSNQLSIFKRRLEKQLDS